MIWNRMINYRCGMYSGVQGNKDWLSLMWCGRKDRKQEKQWSFWIEWVSDWWCHVPKRGLRTDLWNTVPHAFLVVAVARALSKCKQGCNAKRETLSSAGLDFQCNPHMVSDRGLTAHRLIHCYFGSHCILFHLGFFEMKKLLSLIARSKAELKTESLFTGWDYLPVGTARRAMLAP